jgi:glycosyltransferase involved in cell wall biosynthesis
MKAIVVADSVQTSGVADYAARLATELAASAEPSDAPVEAVIYNFTPYGAGVTLGWLRSVRRAGRLRQAAPRFVVVFHEIFVRPDDRFRMVVLERCQRWAARRLDALADATVVADGTRARRLGATVSTNRSAEIIPVGPNIPVPAEPRRGPGPVVVVFGLLHPERDIETVIRAVALLRETIAGVSLRVIGDLRDDPRRERTLRALIADLGAPVSIDGRLDAHDVAAAFASARAFVSTYTRSVNPGSGTLAAAFGHALPVVVYEAADLDEALVPGQTVLVARRDPAAVAEALSVALGEGGEAIGAEGRRLYESELAWPCIADRFSRLIRELTPR